MKSTAKVIYLKMFEKIITKRKTKTKSTFYYILLFFFFNRMSINKNNKHYSGFFSYLVAISNVSNLIICVLHVILYSHLTNPRADDKQQIERIK